MPAGLQVTGSHNILQIDEAYRNLALRVKGTLPATAPSISNFTYPILAIRAPSTSNGAFPIGYSDSGGTRTFGFRDSPNDAEWFIFDVPITQSNVGLQVFDTAGALVFDSGNDYMRPVGSYWIDGTQPAEPVGKKWAWVQTGTGVEEFSSGTPGLLTQFGWALRLDGSNIIQKHTSYPIGSRSGSTPQFIQNPHVFIIDVTDQ